MNHPLFPTFPKGCGPLNPQAARRRLAALFSLLAAAALLLTACGGVFEVHLEIPPTPDEQAIGTLAALIVQSTVSAGQITQMALPATPAPSSGGVSGRICYPSEHIPAMTVYFREARGDRVVGLPTTSGQSWYGIELPPGEYYAYAWVHKYHVGGMYTHAVPCGLGETCTDRSPLAFRVHSGQLQEGIDLCDWVFAVEDLPLPTGGSLNANQPTPP